MPKIYDAYLNSEVDPAFRRRAKIIFDNLRFKDRENVRILDLGCGRGFYVKGIQESWSKCRVVAVDKNLKYLNILKKQVGPRVEVIQEDATKLGLAKESFDYVVCSELLEHIPEDVRAMKEIYRVLKPGGNALITVPCKNYPFGWDPLNWTLERTLGKHVPAHIWWLAGIWADHVRLYSMGELISKLEKVGFVVEKKWTVVHYCLPFSHFLLYGIGKNIVEKGLMKDFDRFNFRPKKSGLLNVVQKIFNWFDQKNDRLPAEFERSCVNIVVKATKSAR